MQLHLTLGPATTRGGLTLYPLFRDAAPAAPYVCGPQAVSLGLGDAAELDGSASVPELQFRNGGSLPVLLLEGEMLVGGKQNRTLNLSVLCPAASTTVIPVSCVERGRWGAPQRASHSARHASPSLRRTKTISSIRSERAGRGKRSDQTAVWSEVDRKLRAHAAPSATSALEDVFSAVEQRGDRILLDDIRPLDDQVGVVAVMGGELAVLDLFDKPESLAMYWSALIDGYGLDAIDAPPVTVDDARIEGFITAIESAAEEPARATGLGAEVHFDAESVVGAALLWDDALVHLSAYSLVPL